METPKPARGRPPTPPEEKLILRAMRLKQAHWDKIEFGGLEQLRKLLEKWKPKPK